MRPSLRALTSSARRWRRKGFQGHEITSSESAHSSLQCERYSLRFQDRDIERRFLKITSPQLVRNAFATGMIVSMAAIVGVVCRLARGYYSRDRYPNEDGYLIQAHAMIFDVVLVIWGLLISVLTKLQQSTDFASPMVVEVGMTIMIAMVVPVVVLSDRWYMGRLRGVEDPAVTMGHTFSDAWLLMSLNAVICVSHNALPIRWCTLWPLEVLLALCYPLLTSGLRSCHDPLDSDLPMSLLLAALVGLSALGKRGSEHAQRLLAASGAAPGAGELGPSLPPELLGGEASAGSLGTQSSEASTGPIFEDIEARSSHAALERLAKVGRREHWLLEASKLKLDHQKILGQGGFGSVIMGCLHGTPVAVKVSRKTATIRNLQQLPALLNELRVLRRVRHPNIVIFHGALIDIPSRELAIVLELVDGKTLRVFGQSPGIGDAERFHVILGVGRALQYLHEQRPSILHGDLKSSNILVEPLGAGSEGPVRAKLLDFGLARVFNKSARPLGGTLAWVAPEVIHSGGNVFRFGTATDVFSLGRVMHFTVTGTMPLQGVKNKAIRTMMLAGHMPSMPWTNSNSVFTSVCKPLCEACVSADPKARPSIADVNEQLLLWPDKVGLQAAIGRQPRNSLTDWREGLDLFRGQKAEVKIGGSPREWKKHDAQSHHGQLGASSSESGGSLASVPENEALDQNPPLPHFKRTPVATQARMLVTIMERWFCKDLRADACCDYHVAARSLLNLSRSMAKKGCNRNFALSLVAQCPNCLALMDEEPEQDEECDVCGHCFLVSGPGSGAGNADLHASLPDRTRDDDEAVGAMSPMAEEGQGFPLDAPCRVIEAASDADRDPAEEAASHRPMTVAL